jgi:large subunit ribosomal protein L35
MPKKKTNKSAAKRVRRTASGKLKFKRPGRGHLLSSKSRKRKRSLRKPGLLSKAAMKIVSRIVSS